jgi:ribonuclease HI
MTNNEAEYATLIAGLEDLARQLISEGIREAEVRLEVRGDSQLVLSQLAGEWRVRNPRLRVLWERARGLLAGYGAVKYLRLPRGRVVAVLGH